MRAKASQFSLPSAMLVRDQVLSLLSELKERSYKQEPTGRVNRSCKTVDMFGQNSSLQWLIACCELSICLASELLFFIFQHSSFWKKKTIYSIYIDKRIAIRGIEWSCRALVSMRAVHLFLRARALINFLMRAASTS